MRWMDEKGLRFFQFPALAAVAGVWHGIFTRYAVDAEQRMTSMNIGLNNTDSEQRVWENRRRMLASGGGGATAVFARQVHGADVAVWESRPVQDAADRVCPDIVWLGADALITAVNGSTLVIQTADCQGVLLVDPEKRVVANVHSGWRGSIKNVLGRTVAAMTERFECRAEDLLCGIGPSLGPCCAEFINYRQEIPPALWSYRRAGDHFDFWQMSIDQLTGAGVQRQQISVSAMCTRCNPRLFFSYRAEGAHAGRFAALIRLQG
jgi:polyphenol oxidase